MSSSRQRKRLLAATSLNGIARLPAPAFLFGFPPYGGIHYLRFQSLDDEDGWLLLADKHAPDLKCVKGNIDQDELTLRRCGAPAFFAVAKNYQQMLAVFRIGIKAGHEFGLAEAEVGAVGISHFVFEREGIRQRI